MVETGSYNSEALAVIEKGEVLVKRLKEHSDVKGKIGMIFVDTRTQLFYVMEAKTNKGVSQLEGFKKLKQLILEKERTLEPDDRSARYFSMPIGGFRVRV